MTGACGHTPTFKRIHTHTHRMRLHKRLGWSNAWNVIFIRIWNVFIPLTLFGQIRSPLIFNRFYFYFHPHRKGFRISSTISPPTAKRGDIHSENRLFGGAKLSTLDHAVHMIMLYMFTRSVQCRQFGTTKK